MNLYLGKRFTIKCVGTHRLIDVEVVKLPEINDMFYKLKIYGNKIWNTAYYEASSGKVFNSYKIHLPEWEAVDTPFSQLSFVKQCDCGGFKVYNSFDSFYHSSWCSSQKETA